MSIAQQRVAVDARHAARDTCRALTRREKEVLVLTCTGLLQKEVAAQLGLSKRTVECTLVRARERLGVDTLIEAVVMATKAGLV
jgi:DNA-binding NarL/FixJ family response regulator